jgi:sugar lactone lactonase YvrE
MSDRFDFLELDNTRRRSPRRPAHSPRSQPVGSSKAASHQPAGAWKVAERIGGPGTAAGQFACPAGLALDAAGNLYVADSYNHRIQRITRAGDVYLMGRRGTGPGAFLNPQAVAPDGGLGFYVLEQGGCRIQHFGPNGEWQGAFGSPGSGRGQMRAPMAMARGPCGSLFVADSGNNRIVKWSPSDVFLDVYPPVGAPALLRPQGIAVDRAGRVWVSETLGHRIQLFDALFRPLGTRGAPGPDPGQLREPQDLAITPAGRVIVADTGNHRLQVLEGPGEPEVIAIATGQRSPIGPLVSPSGLAVRGEEELYVADTGNHRILRLVRG